jgi:hypothetical protein
MNIYIDCPLIREGFSKLGYTMPTLTQQGAERKRECISEVVPTGIDDEVMMLYIAKAFHEAGADVSLIRPLNLHIQFRDKGKHIGNLTIQKFGSSKPWSVMAYLSDKPGYSTTCPNDVVGHHLINLIFDKFREAYLG